MLAKKILVQVCLLACSLQAAEEHVPKGTLIEASFILQNKINSLKELREKLNNNLKDATHSTRRLIEEKALLEKSLKRAQTSTSNEEIEKAQILFSLHENTLYGPLFEKAFYPDFISMVDYYRNMLLKKSSTLLDELYTQTQVKTLIDEANYIYDLVSAQSHYVDQFLALHDHKNKIQNKERAERYYKKVLEDRSLDFNAEKTKEQAKLIQELKSLRHTGVEKQREINRLKQKIAELYKKLKTVTINKFSKEWFYKGVMNAQSKAEKGKKEVPPIATSKGRSILDQ